MHKHIPYAGGKKGAASKLVKNEVCKEANSIYSAYTSPQRSEFFTMGSFEEEQ